MRHTTAAVLLTAAAFALTGCSSSDPKPEATVTATATKTPTQSAAELRAACVNAWAAVLQEDADSDPDQAPSDCAGVPESDQLDAYMDGLQQRNQANRDSAKDCLDDPTCTSLPIP